MHLQTITLRDEENRPKAIAPRRFLLPAMISRRRRTTTFRSECFVRTPRPSQRVLPDRACRTESAMPALTPDLSVIGLRVRDQMRVRMRATRRALGPAAVAARSERIVSSLLALPVVEHARAVGLFWPRTSHAEVDLRPLDQ